MQIKQISFINILTRKANKKFYTAALFIFVLAVSAFWLAAIDNPAKAEKAKNLRGAEAVGQLKQNGQYDSLMEAMKAARRAESGQNDSDSFTATEAMPPTAKLYAPDGAPANFFGYSVALGGDTAIVGVPLDSLESTNPASVSEGSAYVFTRSGASWTLQQKLTAADGANRDYFGANVSIDGDTAIVGALFDDVGASVNQGSAYVFTRSGTVWTQQAKLAAAQGAAGDRFGVSVEISGETVVIGTKRDQGAAYVFTRSGTAWTQQQQLIPSNGAAGDEFGGSVAINGETILVSATGRPVSGADNQGAVYVFTRSGGVWSEQQILTAADGAAGDRFGSDVAIKDSAAIVGAYFDDIGANADQGSAYIFTRIDSVWTPQAKLLAADGAAGDHFGSSVAIGGNTAVVGAPDNDFPGVLDDIYTDAGSAYVFTGGATWTQQAQLSQENVGGIFGDSARFGGSAAISGETVLVGIHGADNEDGLAGVYVRSGTSWSLQSFLADDEDSSGDDFGYSVAIDGDTAVVGAPFDDLGASREQGSAYVFLRSSATNTWAFQAKLTASDGAPGIAFGSDVAISGNTIVVGTSIVFVSFTTSANSESAYVFVRSGETWTQQQKLTPSDGAPGEAFGSTVSISGETIVVGAPFHGTSDRGAAYVFARSGGAWSQQQKLFAPNPGQNETHYGYSVAVSGDTIIVGAPRYGNGGQIHAYVRSATEPTTWILQQIMSANDTNVCDALGLEVALSGNTLIASTNRGLYTGAGCTIQNGYSVYIFARSGITWTRQQKLHDSSVDVSDVAIHGDTAVFGTTARRSNQINLNESAAFVFTRTGTSWTPREPLITADDATSDGAADVAVFGNTVIVGATQDELDLNINQDVDFTSHQGSAYIFNIPDAPACGFTLNPTSQSFTSSGGSGSFTVSASSPNCSWIADSDSSWLTVTSGASGTGNGTISYSVAANQTSNPRTGTINVGGQIFTVTQAGIVGTVFTVMNTNDSGAGSLRDAISQANTTTESRTIVFDQTLFSTPQIITLASNLLISNSNGGTITIIGPGANLLTINGGGGRRIFTISSNSVVVISGMTLTAGNGTGSVASGNGGAIYSNADLTLNNVVVNANATTGGGNFGGGIYQTLRGLAINNCVVSNNTTTGRGGGIYIDSNVTATISATTVNNNTASGFGGGIYSSVSSTLVLTGSNVADNSTLITSATDGGGGIFTTATSFTMTDSTVSGNRAVNGSGGGVAFTNSGTNTINRSTVSGNSASGNGGGLNFSNTQLSVTNSTISHNRANGNGGGINRNNTTPATQTFSYTTIAFNSAANTGGGVNTQAAIQFNNTIVGAGSAQTAPDFAGTLNSGGYNLVKDTTGTTISGTTTGNLTGVDPRLDGVLRSNGGTTKTLALRPSSPAIDAGNPAVFPATDQRSLPRPVDGDGNGGARSDIGAYERQPNELVVPALFDFDGDGRADLSVFRPSEQSWYILGSSSSQLSGAQFGLASDKLAPADYDGDGKTDIAVWRDEPSNPDRANFYILHSSTGVFRAEQFGRTGDQPSVVGDWDGDGKADLAVFRDGGAAGNQSYFFYRPSSQPGADFTTVYWGTGGDKPMRGDFDGDGKSDAAVFRPSDGIWYIRQSSDSQLKVDSWGLATDRFVPADYDGDGKTDLAVFRDGIWYIKQSSNNQPRYERFGLSTDSLVPADYDGDGKADVAVFRDGNWYLLRSQQGFSAAQFGIAGDRAIPAAFMP